MTTINCIVQARMGSTRFPGKIMALLDGKPMIGHLLDELLKCERVDQLIFALPSRLVDKWAGNELADYLIENGSARGLVGVCYGPEEDVAERFRVALEVYPCDYFIRVCADSPLMPAWCIDDIASCRPEAMVEFAQFDRLGKPQIVHTETWLKALPFFDAYDREHVTTFFTRRLIVDTPEDLEYVERWVQFQKLIS